MLVGLISVSFDIMLLMMVSMACGDYFNVLLTDNGVAEGVYAVISMGFQGLLA